MREEQVGLFGALKLLRFCLPENMAHKFTFKFCTFYAFGRCFYSQQLISKAKVNPSVKLLRKPIDTIF